MKITHQEHDSVTVLNLQGDFTSEDTDALRKLAVAQMEKRVRDFVLDLSQVPFVDSKALETLLWLQEEAIAMLGQIRLAACSETIIKVLEITRLNSRFECHEDLESAVKSLR